MGVLVAHSFPDLLILRHGETEWNRQGRWQGDLDSPLTETGVAQARAMGRLLVDMGVTPDSHDFWTSPLGRARQTALEIGTAFSAGGPLFREDARLREISVGDWIGMTRQEILQVSDLSEDAHFMDFYAAAPQGESFEQMSKRARGFLQTLTRPAVVVTHGITSRVLRAVVLGWDLPRLAELPGGQGVIHRVCDGRHEEWAP